MMTSLSTLIAMVPLIVGNIGPGAGEGYKISCRLYNIWWDVNQYIFNFIYYPSILFLLCKNSKRMDEIDIQLSKEFSK